MPPRLPSVRAAAPGSRSSAWLAAAATAALAALTTVVVAVDRLPGERRLLRAGAVAPDGTAATWWQVVSDATGTAPLLAVAAMGCVVLVAARQHASAFFLAVSGVGVAVLTPLLKALVGRERPGVVALPADLSPSYPSGHTAMTAAVLGAAVVVLARRVSARTRAVVVAGTALLLVVVAASQLALARHFPSDLVAGWLLAAAWLGVLSAGRPWLARRLEGAAAARG